MLLLVALLNGASGSNLLRRFGEAKDLKVVDKSILWYVYIVQCKDGKLYVGITKDLDRRIKLHKQGLACRFTKYRKPVRLVYKEKCDTKSEARRRELQIKRYGRKKKLELICE